MPTSHRERGRPRRRPGGEARALRPKPAVDRKSDPAARLREAITGGKFLPNQRLIETDLAEFLGTNRANVRTALARLEQEGLVVSEPNRGARVRLVSEAEAIEITEVRRLLEGHEAARAAQRVTAREAATLHGILRDMRAAVERSELLGYSDLNVRLHAAIRDISGHQTTARLLRQLRDQTMRHQFTLSLVPGRPAVSLPQHAAIVAAVTAGDPAAAERAMHDHLRSVADALQALLAATASR